MAKKKKTTKKKTTKKTVAIKKATKKAKSNKKKVLKKVTKKTLKKTPKKLEKKTAKKGTVKKTASKKAATKKSSSAKKSSNGSLVSLNAESVLGQKVKAILLEATGDQKVSLADFVGKNLVVYFYPKDSTPGCTQEGLDFTRLKAEFENHNTVIFGVSRDSIASHEKFKSNQGYKFDLISDPEEKLCRYFGVIQPKSLYGKQFMGVIRSTFIIDKDGVLKKEWRNVKVSGHAEEVLEAIKSL